METHNWPSAENKDHGMLSFKWDICVTSPSSNAQGSPWKWNQKACKSKKKWLPVVKQCFLDMTDPLHV